MKLFTTVQKSMQTRQHNIKFWQQFVFVSHVGRLLSIIRLFRPNEILLVHSKKCTLLKVGTCPVRIFWCTSPRKLNNPLDIRLLWCWGCNEMECKRESLGMTSNDVCLARMSTGVNAAGDARDTSPPIFWLVGTSMGISPPILLRTFGYSRPILVVLAQWQYLMVSFIHLLLNNVKFATESTKPHWGGSR